MKDKTMYIVHCVDTEGPLHESLRANFERVEQAFGHSINPSYENLKKLQNGEMDLAGDEELIQRMLSSQRISTLGTWDKIDSMLDTITHDAYRNEFKDSFNNGWIYNWFCMDHVGITGINPRRRDIGYHNIFDHYKEYLEYKESNLDQIYWHYHALSITNDAHRAGSTYLNSSNIYNILCRRIIDRSWFPSAFRAGHNTIRPDSHFFLEQWVPFDFSNAGGGFDENDTISSYARYGDWRRAPRSWIPYHPSHDDYQTVGSCRRYISRCLSIDDREYSITSDDIAAAFQEARDKGKSILGFTNHDFRDMKPDLDRVKQMIKAQHEIYKDVKIKFSNAVDAMRSTCNIDSAEKFNLDVSFRKHKTHDILYVNSEGSIFGPQPYLALKTKSGDYFWQNFDFEQDNQWSYSFDQDNICLENIESIGIASSSLNGTVHVINIDVRTNNVMHTKYN